MFTFERLHKLHFEVFKLVKKYTVKYLSSDRPSTEAEKIIGQFFVKIGSLVLQGCNLLLKDIEIAGKLPGSRIDLCKAEGHQMNGTESLQRQCYMQYWSGRTTDY